MKKILLLAPMASVQERFNVANIEALKKLDCEIHIVANFELSEHDMNYRRNADDSGIKTHQLPFVRGSLLRNLHNVPEIKKLLKSEKFDIVHCHTETGGILTRLSMSADKSAKYVYTPHGMSFYKGSSLKSRLIYYPIEKWICSKMSANLAMNSEESENLEKWDRKTAKFIHGIGLDLSEFRKEADGQKKRLEFDIPPDAKLILSVGELNNNKNHSVVLKAISEIPDSNIYYMVCGDGENRESLKSLASELKMENRLVLTGFRYDIKEIYRIADVFAFPSYQEGLSVSLMEAMAAGLPIVCSKIRGNVDLIEEGNGGFLLEPTDVNGFKNAIEKL
ncbi:MAG: glycosyltransferase, partial [Oscillospiraceae bacterium]